MCWLLTFLFSCRPFPTNIVLSSAACLAGSLGLFSLPREGKLKGLLKQGLQLKHQPSPPPRVRERKLLTFSSTWGKGGGNWSSLLPGLFGAAEHEVKSHGKDKLTDGAWVVRSAWGVMMWAQTEPFPLWFLSFICSHIRPPGFNSQRPKNTHA